MASVSGQTNTSGDNEIIPAVAGHSIILQKIRIQNVSGAETTYILKSGTTEIDRVFTVQKTQGINETPAFKKILGYGEPLVLNLSAGNLTYYSIDYILL